MNVSLKKEPELVQPKFLKCLEILIASRRERVFLGATLKAIFPCASAFLYKLNFLKIFELRKFREFYYNLLGRSSDLVR